MAKLTYAQRRAAYDSGITAALDHLVTGTTPLSPLRPGTRARHYWQRGFDRTRTALQQVLGMMP